MTRRLEHENGQARAFYAPLPKPARIGIEATGYTEWFERMLAELGDELWVGDPAGSRARAVRRQKTDTHDAEHLLTCCSGIVFRPSGYPRRRNATCGNG